MSTANARIDWPRRKGSASGRVRKLSSKSPIQNSPIYRLLERTLPDHLIYESGGIHVRALAEAVNIHYFSIYRWFNGSMISVASAKQLLDYCQSHGGSLTREDLLPFTDSL